MPDALVAPTRPGGRRRRARDDPARVRRRAAAPAAAPARRADPVRGAALAGDRGRRAARDERRLRQQRAPARPRDARGDATSARRDPRAGARRRPTARCSSATSTAFERYDIDALTSLIQEDATQSMPPFDLWLRGRDDILTWWFGPGHRLRRLARDPGADGQRLAGVRPVQAERDGERLRAVGAPGPRAVRRPDRRVHVLPRHRDAVPALRAARPPRRLAPRARPIEARPASASSCDAFCSRSSTPRRFAAELKPRERVDGGRVRRASEPTSQTIFLGRHACSHRPNGDPKLIGRSTDEFRRPGRSNVPRPTERTRPP